MNVSCRVPGVVGVVVTYHPNPHALETLLDSVLRQLNTVILVDNASDIDLCSWLAARYGERVVVFELDENKGVALAQNVGLKYANEIGASYVVLFDQDSVPEANMVSQLVNVAEEKVSSGILVAGIGPCYLDERQDNPPPFITIEGLKLVRQEPNGSNPVVEVDYLVSSGCLIPMSTVAAVGGMREELFIDYVDIEWGLRAKYMGYQSFGVYAAKMCHVLGEKPIRMFGRSYPSHSPLRHYYHFRNAVWMYRESWVPTCWKLVDGYRLFMKYIFYSLFTRTPVTHFRMMTLGICHGIVRKLGRYDG